MLAVSLWDRVVRPAARVLAVVSATLCGALALLITVEVAMRGSTGSSIRGLFEIAELALVMTVFLGFAQAEVNETHVRVTLLTDRLKPRAANAVRGAALLLAAAFMIWMGWELLERAVESFVVGEFRSGLLNFPMWPSRAFVAAGSVFLAIILLAKGFVFLAGRKPSGATEHIEGGAV